MVLSQKKREWITSLLMQGYRNYEIIKIVHCGEDTIKKIRDDLKKRGQYIDAQKRRNVYHEKIVIQLPVDLKIVITKVEEEYIVELDYAPATESGAIAAITKIVAVTLEKHGFHPDELTPVSYHPMKFPELYRFTSPRNDEKW